MRTQEEDDIQELKGSGYKAIAKQYRHMIRALRVLHTWAACDDDFGSLDPQAVMDLCMKALRRFR